MKVELGILSKRSKIGWTILDQGVVSLINFSLNFILARYASPEVFGHFTLIFMIILLINALIHSPLTLEPLIIIGGKINDRETQLIYLKKTLVFNLLLSFFSIIILIIISAFFWFFGNSIYANVMFMSSIPLFFVNLRFFIRCYYIMKGEFAKAFKNNFVALIIVVLGSVLMIYLKKLNILEIIILMTVSEASAILFFIIINKIKLFHIVSFFLCDLVNQPMFWKWKEIQQNWNYGKWLMMSSFGNYIYNNAQFLLLPLFTSVYELAGYRACYLLAQPIYLFTTGIEAYVWSKSAKIMGKGNINELQNFLNEMAKRISLLIILYNLLIGINSRLVIEILYKGKFIEFSNLVWFFTFANLINFWGKLIGSGLRALESTKILLIATLFSGIIGLITFFILLRLTGIIGASISYVLSSFIAVLISLLYFRKEADLLRTKLLIVK
jgi:O-antigen/teichoic acid export membrane protein